MLRKWTPREKYVKYQNFMTQFGLLLSLECSDEVSPKICRICLPYKFDQSGRISPKIICGIFGFEGSETIVTTPDKTHKPFF